MARIVPVFITLVPTIQILTQYVCVMMHDEIPMPAFLIFPVIWVNVFVNNIFVFTLASWINNVSARTLREQVGALVKCRLSGRRSHIIKEVKACTVLKIKFGSNFIDKGTALVIQNFCLVQTMSLILIGGSSKGA